MQNGGKREAVTLDEIEILVGSHIGNGAGVRLWKDLNTNIR